MNVDGKNTEIILRRAPCEGVKVQYAATRTAHIQYMYNKAMLDWLLEDWMPWFNYDRNYSTMDVNRYKELCNGNRLYLFGIIWLLCSCYVFRDFIQILK
jgi:hypothetical protein